MLIRRAFFPALSLVLLVAGCKASIKPGQRVDSDMGAEEMVDLAMCAAGVDSDHDGLDDDVECYLGTDPVDGDSDHDGVPDGIEAHYPRICVASSPDQQVRPPVTCLDDSECPDGTCVGLSPTSSDTDGDGVPDGQEDTNLDGMIDTPSGETDPRLADSDGDGVTDDKGGLNICRPQGLAQVDIAQVPPGVTQVGHAPTWATTASVNGTMAGEGALLLDDAGAQVSAVVFALRSTGDVRAEQMRVESAIARAIGTGITPVLVGSTLTTHEMEPAITSTYRIVKASHASSLRDLLVPALIGTASPGGASVGPSGEFILDVTTVRRTTGPAADTADAIVTIAPAADVSNPTQQTAIRASDLVNTTGVAEGGKGVGSACQVFRAEQSAVADFIWTVDTSSSMGDDQQRLGNTATQFFQQLDAAGVDFRVAVLQAGSGALNIDTPGLKFISGTDPMGATRLCEQVTSAALAKCPTSASDTVSPYVFPGSQEEPTAAAVIAFDVLDRRTKMNDPNPDRRFRDGAQVVTFHVTDEPGSNDFSRYFASKTDPQTGKAWGSVYNATSLGNIVDYFKRNSILTYGLVPISTTPCSNVAVADLPRCVIEGNGGAVIPIATATQAEIDAAMSKIVLAVAGATSQFALTRSPITSTIQVNVGGVDVPRSRADGFDYDPARRSIIFFGRTYRPKQGDQVVISYRVWEGSVG